MHKFFINYSKFFSSYLLASIIALLVDGLALLYFDTFLDSVSASVSAYLLGGIIAFLILKRSRSIIFKKVDIIFFRSELFAFLLTGFAGLLTTYLVFSASTHYGLDANIFITKVVAVIASFLLTLFLRILVLLIPANTG
jgi:hypothetical protein